MRTNDQLPDQKSDEKKSEAFSSLEQAEPWIESEEAPADMKVEGSEHSQEPRHVLNNQDSEVQKKLVKPDVLPDQAGLPPAQERRDGLANSQILPVLPIKEGFVYPLASQLLTITQERSQRLIEDAMRGNRLVLLVAERSTANDLPVAQNIFAVGTIVRIARRINLPDATMQIIVQGLERAVLGTFAQTEPYLLAEVQNHPESHEQDQETEEIMRSVVQHFQRLVALGEEVPEGVVRTILNLEDARQLVYMVATFVQMELALRQNVLELDSVRAKLEAVRAYLADRLEALAEEKPVQQSPQEKIAKAYREDILREQLKVIQRELSQESEEQASMDELRKRVEAARMPDEVSKEARRELARLEKLSAISPEYSSLRTYIELLASLPWSKSSGTKIDVHAASEVLEQDHYGLTKVKERILEYLAVRHLKEERRAATEKLAGSDAHPPLSPVQPVDQIDCEPILCFVGPPGVGKTSLGQSIARALGRPFARISLGGLGDEAEIRGHRRTYTGAMPGKLIQILRRLEANDPIIMLDEIDKLGASGRGDPSSALLEVLDPAQNTSFRDHYLNVPFDLSKIMFLATANTLEPISPALRDRMEILSLSSYTAQEKLHIASRYLLPRQIETNGLSREALLIEHETIKCLISDYTREAGVRNLEREIGSLCRKGARLIAEGRDRSIHIQPEDLLAYLGPPRYKLESAERIDRPGIAIGLTWTQAGGKLMFIEATYRAARDCELILTGHLGAVMQESAQAALSFVRSHTEVLGLPATVFEAKSVHIHIPAGSIPKDGPSAGVGILTALVSLASGRKVRSNVAMTGEISLRGKVLPIGGVKEKVLAASFAGLRTIILPEKNRQDLEGLPLEILQQIECIFASDIQTVLMTAIEGYAEHLLQAEMQSQRAKAQRRLAKRLK